MIRYSISVQSSRVESAEIFAHRLSVSSGTGWAEEVGLSGYEADARVAIGGWSRASYEQGAQLTATDGAKAHNCVGLVRIESHHLRDLRSLIEPLRSAAQRAEARRELKRSVLSIGAALPEMAGWHMLSEPINIGIAQESGGYLNTTVNQESGLRVGLHLDSFDGLPPEERWRGSNRLCLNLGQAERGLQFVPVETSEILRMLQAQSVTTPGTWPRLQERKLDLARSFLAAYPEAIVVRLWLQPGEGYIAPTENMVHDGMSKHCLSPDVTMTIRGHFIPRNRTFQRGG